ncbi:MAG TPA: hypothetical protein VJ623_04210 [Holophagaceae bacterium]|nr:hypothetical protein [Holophagaceae bacterium]
MNPFRSTSLLLVLAGLLACGGGSSSSGGGGPKYQLTYTNANRTGINLVGVPSLSTPTHLVLGLIVTDPSLRPAGISLDLEAEAGVTTWAKVGPSDAEYVRPGSGFDLGSGLHIVKGKLSGNRLQVIVSQKTYDAPASLHGYLAYVALDLDPKVQSTGVSGLRANGPGNKILTTAGMIEAFEPVAGIVSVQ